jgi:hypothetical protein
MITVRPRDIGLAKRLPQRPVDPVSPRDLMQISPTSIPEPFDVHDKNGSMYGRSHCTI